MNVVNQVTRPSLDAGNTGDPTHNVANQSISPELTARFQNTNLLNSNMNNILMMLITLLSQLIGQNQTGTTTNGTTTNGTTTNGTSPSGDQTPVTVTSNNGLTTLNGTATYDVTFLQQQFEAFKNSPAYPQVQTLDNRVSAWGHQGSSSEVTAFYNWLLTSFPQGGTTAGTNPAFGNQTPVNANSANGQTTVSNDTNSVNLSNADLLQRFQEFRNSAAYPTAETRDLVTTPWGYSGSSSALTAFYNALLVNAPPAGNGGTPAPTPPSGDQTPVTVTSNNGLTTLNGTATYDVTFLQQQFEAFKNSPAYPQVQTLDNRVSAWGHQGSSSEVTAFYNWLLTSFPQGGTTAGTNPAFGNQTPVNANSANGQTTVSNDTSSVNLSNADLLQRFQEFRNSAAYPTAETRDLVTTPWGYSGSSSALTAFYNALLVNAPPAGNGGTPTPTPGTTPTPTPTPTPGTTPTPSHNCAPAPASATPAPAAPAPAAPAPAAPAPAAPAPAAPAPATPAPAAPASATPAPATPAPATPAPAAPAPATPAPATPAPAPAAPAPAPAAPAPAPAAPAPAPAPAAPAPAPAPTPAPAQNDDPFGHKFLNGPFKQLQADQAAAREREAAARRTPVALDLNNDGKINTTGETTAQHANAGTELGQTVNFDLNADGQKESIEWLAGNGDGFLVDNRDGQAAANMNGDRLFGDMNGRFENGFEKMATFDKNQDGQLSGAELNGLNVWVDDGDAQVEAGEMKSLNELGITSLDVNKDNVLNDRGETLMQSTATNNDGSKVLTEDVWLGVGK